MRYPIPRYDLNLTSQTLSDTYTTIYYFSGIGYLQYFEVNFSDSGWKLKLTIDGIDAFELSEQDLSNFNFVNVDNATEVKGNIFIKNTGKDLYFEPKQGLFFQSSVEIQAKRETTTSPNCARILVHYIEEVEA